MTPSLAGRIAAALAAPVAEPVRAFAERLAQAAGARAALFYGSNLRTGALDGVLDGDLAVLAELAHQALRQRA